jgi:DMSO/TMAO reductase YedYZ molybdopterin-dependent catalytic subunit
MQAFKRHKKIVILAVILAVIIIVSAFIVQNNSKPSLQASSSPTPTTQTPTQTPKPSPTPTTSPITTMPTFQSFIPNPVLTPLPAFSSERYPGEITQYQGVDLSPINAVYQNAIAGTQNIDQTTYRLTVTGLVNKTIDYTYDQVVNNHQTYPKVVTIVCVEGWSATLLWEGISVNDLLKETGISPQATVIIFHASDGYTTVLPLDYIVQNNIIIAYRINNVTLTPTTGWPFMLVGQNEYGYKWIKWITEIEASNDTNYLGYWESRGYSNNATLP